MGAEKRSTLKHGNAEWLERAGPLRSASSDVNVRKLDSILRRDYGVPAGVGRKLIDALQGEHRAAMLRAVNTLLAQPAESSCPGNTVPQELAAKHARCMARLGNVPPEQAGRVIDALQSHPEGIINAILNLLMPMTFDREARLNKLSGINITNLQQYGMSKDTISLEPDADAIVTATATVAAHNRLDTTELKLLLEYGRTAKAAAQQATINAQETERLNDLTRLSELRLKFYQRSQAAELLGGGVTNDLQAKAANNLGRICGETRALETQLFGTPTTDRTQLVKKLDAQRMAYRRAKVAEP